ncbi:MAG: hypothetical protein HPY69_07510 [Armatimonadetes bacterium]|nr:hypothetical protein [Armatimonadota bacterium]
MPALTDPQGRSDAEQKLLAGCDRRIRLHRMADLTVEVRDAQGRPVPGAQVRVQQTRHAFLFGCNAYALGALPDAKLNRAYEQQFAALFNYATLPFYWGSYEPEEGRTSEQRLQRMADWCVAHGIRAKGHPLVWHEVPPAWLAAKVAGLEPAQAAKVVEGLLERRVRSIIPAFAGKIEYWDVINEATVSALVANGVGAWVKSLGHEEAVARALSWAREAGPQAKLLVNDFNVWPRLYTSQLRYLNDRDVSYDAVGIQSHMHAGTPPLDTWWKLCERYARYGKPLHFTEMTVLSGALKTDSDWMSHHPGWETTPEGEQRQARYVTSLYRILFSHRAVQAITWWDFSDAAAWQGAPAGMVRKDMSPKPVYTELLRLVRGEWWTDEALTTDSRGRVRLRAFLGDYRITVRHKGLVADCEATLSRETVTPWAVTLR